MRKVFIGSSTPAFPQAVRVAEILSGVPGIEPRLWKTEFRAGLLTFEAIELESAIISGAIFLATPDDEIDAGSTRITVPRTNVMIEWGFMSAVLGRERVFLCAYDGAILPSDLHGITAPRMGAEYIKDRNAPITSDVAEHIVKWASGLPIVADGIPLTSVLHGYSGRWRASFDFSRYRGVDVVGSNYVTGNSNFELHIPLNGKGGHGYEVGDVAIHLDGCQGTARFTLDLDQIFCEPDGRMNIECKPNNIIREFHETSGCVEDKWRRDFAATFLSYDLAPDPLNRRTLRGTYKDRRGDREQTVASLTMTKLLSQNQ